MLDLSQVKNLNIHKRQQSDIFAALRTLIYFDKSINRSCFWHIFIFSIDIKFHSDLPIFFSKLMQCFIQ